VRGAYMWRDLERLARKFAIPWRRPSHFPRPTTLPLRVACSIAREAWCGDFVRRVFVANFGEDREIGEREVVDGILAELGQPADEVIGRALGPERRGFLRANTERAVEVGIFGSPNCLVDGELFWGEEVLEDAIAWALERSGGENRPA
jgi:2-hydroxychromene-2-carboxylate isomerase